MKRIATRTFKDTKTERKIVANVFEPKETRDGTWSCRIVIRGLRKAVQTDVLGEDSLQALQIAIQGIRFHLEQSDRPITWLDEAGDFGIYRELSGFDVATTRKLESLIRREAARLTKRKRR